jgi:hypothetical protein
VLLLLRKELEVSSTLEIAQRPGSTVTFRKLPTLRKKKPTNIDSYSFGQSLNAPFNILRPRKGEFLHSSIIHDRACGLQLIYSYFDAYADPQILIIVLTYGMSRVVDTLITFIAENNNAGAVEVIS